MDKSNNDFLDKLVHINRITKVVKGGRRFGLWRIPRQIRSIRWWKGHRHLGSVGKHGELWRPTPQASRRA